MSTRQKQIIFTKDAPKPIGPYSQAVVNGNMIFISGQVSIDPKTGTVPESTEVQTRQVMANLLAVLKSVDPALDFSNIVKTTIFMQGLAEYETINKVYAEYFKEGEYPARSVMGLPALPRGIKVGIEAIAMKE